MTVRARLGSVRARLASMRARIRGKLSHLRDERIIARCDAAVRRSPSRTMAVFLPSDGHLKFVADTLAELKAREVQTHCFTEPAVIPALQQAMGSTDVYPYRLCSRIPYRAILTPATHIPAAKYKHTLSQVAHLPHSMVSLHTIFPAATFLGFDHVFCCGPHHLKEIHAIFKHNGQNARAVGTGYEVIDRLGREVVRKPREGRPCVMIAPSWGETSLLYRFGRALVDRLILHYDVILRPHKWHIEEIADVIDGLQRDYKDHKGFTYDLAIDPRPSMDAADVMISDFSGAAFEFALGCLRPVIFIDGPRKNAYINWQEVLNEEGIEVSARDRIGAIVNDLDGAEAAIRAMLAAPREWEKRLTSAREELLFNYGRCASVAADRLMEILDERPA